MEQTRRLVRECFRHISLSHYDDELPATLFTDASGLATGAVLTQRNRVVAIHSKTLTTAQTRYSTTDREALALVHGVEAFRVMLHSNQQLELATDHTALLNRNDERLTPRQTRWKHRVLAVAHHTRYVPGAENPADYWSRQGALGLKERGGVTIIGTDQLAPESA